MSIKFPETQLEVCNYACKHACKRSYMYMRRVSITKSSCCPTQLNSLGVRQGVSESKPYTTYIEDSSAAISLWLSLDFINSTVWLARISIGSGGEGSPAMKLLLKISGSFIQTISIAPLQVHY